MADAWDVVGLVVESKGTMGDYLPLNYAKNWQILPWDSDSDVQVTEASMQYLATYYNMSVFHYKTPRIPEGRDYMLEVNPHYVNREQTDKLNVIDARWVDTTSGLFIDITTARYNYTHPAGEGMLSCKDGHEFRVSQTDHICEPADRLRTHTFSLCEIRSLKEHRRRFHLHTRRYSKRNIKREH
jgi:hypothetical protein